LDLDIEVRGATVPYSISVVSLDSMFYGVRTETRGSVSRFRIPAPGYVVVELRFASGHVLARTVPLANVTAKRARIVLSRGDAILALDLMNASHTVSAKSLGRETNLARSIALFEEQMEAGKLNAAEAALWQLADSQPGSPLPWNNLGALRLATGNLEEAATFLQRALQICDWSFETNLNLSRVKLAQGDRQGALIFARKSSRIRPGHPSALAQEAGTLLQMERFLDARPLLEDLLRTDPYHATFPDLGLAVVLEHLGESDDAARSVLAWADKHPLHPSVASLRQQAERTLLDQKVSVERTARR